MISDIWVPRRSAGSPVRVRRIAPAQATGATLIWIHGGGYVMGDATQDDAFLSQLASAVGCSTFSVDVRLAPEDPYPAALDDAAVVFDWVRKNAIELGVDGDCVAVGGASAGGGIAAALTLRARDEGSDQPCSSCWCTRCWTTEPALERAGLSLLTPERGRPRRIGSRGLPIFATSAATSRPTPHQAGPSRLPA